MRSAASSHGWHARETWKPLIIRHGRPAGLLVQIKYALEIEFGSRLLVSSVMAKRGLFMGTCACIYTLISLLSSAVCRARVCAPRSARRSSGLRTEMHTARSFLQIDRWMEKSAFGCDTCGYGRCETPYGSASQVDDGSQGHEWRWLLAGWHVTVPFVPDPFEPSGRQELLPKISSCSNSLAMLAPS